MRFWTSGAALAALAFIVASCSESGTLNPILDKTNPPVQAVINPAHNGIRISEFHYDNTGIDTGEAVEVSAPADADLSGYAIVLYNGSNNSVYDTDLLSTGTTTVCVGGTRKVVVISYPRDGLQNGSPDGVALVGPDNSIIEFLSYEGSMPGATEIRGTNGLPISQASTEPVGSSLQRLGFANVWVKGANKFHACNDNDDPAPPPTARITVTPATVALVEGTTQQFTATSFDASDNVIGNALVTWSSTDASVAKVSANGVVTAEIAGAVTITAAAPNGVSASASVTVVEPPPPPDLPSVRFSEIHYDNTNTDIGEAIEIEGPAGTDLAGWSIVLYNGDSDSRRVYNTRVLSGIIEATCTTLPGRGVLHFEYPANGIQNGSPDGFALVNAAGNVVEFLSYEGTFTAVDGPAAGRTSLDIGVAQPSPLGQTLQRRNSGAWQGPKSATIGGCNSGGPITRASAISFSGRLSTDPPLPVGFEDQVFARALNLNTGQQITTTFAWSSDTPELASVDADGVVHAHAAGVAVIRATAADGGTATHSLPTFVATASTTAHYGNHVEFGTPKDADDSDDFIVSRAQYVTSFNGVKNIPNWAAYNLEATHFGDQERCDCFTYDPELPATFSRYTTADYTGAGAFHGYGIDRGHLVRSFDREAGSLDNATTFYFSNIVPQAADNNQGPWSDLENYLGGLAQSGNHEIYIVAGASGSKGTVKNEGIITIPSHMWKVAVILPRDRGLADVDSDDDIQVIAAIMPNEPGIRDSAWTAYDTTVDAVEALSGYDVLALLRDDIEILVESNLRVLLRGLIANGTLTRGEGNSLRAKIDAALKRLADDDRTPAANQLEAVVHELDAMVKSGRLTAADVAALRAALVTSVRSITD